MILTKEQEDALRLLTSQAISREKFDEYFADELEIITEAKNEVERLEQEINELLTERFMSNEERIQTLQQLFSDLEDSSRTLRREEQKVRTGKDLLKFLNIQITGWFLRAWMPFLW